MCTLEDQYEDLDDQDLFEIKKKAHLTLDDNMGAATRCSCRIQRECKSITGEFRRKGLLHKLVMMVIMPVYLPLCMVGIFLTCWIKDRWVI
jgi:hypothetical protein